MNCGVLTIKTPYSSSDLKVKWKKVQRIKSVDNFLVTGSDGGRHKVQGLDVGRSDDALAVKDSASVSSVDDIVFIKPVKDDFVSRLNASILFGHNLTRASNLPKYNRKRTGKNGF